MPDLSAIYAPTTTFQLSIYYFVWILLYGGINIAWDIRSSKTPAFHFTHLNGKVSALYNAASFASSLLVLVGCFSEPVRKIAGDTVAPLVLAGFSGLIVSLAEICPYKPKP